MKTVTIRISSLAASLNRLAEMTGTAAESTYIVEVNNILEEELQKTVPDYDSIQIVHDKHFEIMPKMEWNKWIDTADIVESNVDRYPPTLEVLTKLFVKFINDNRR